jgi:hypothetical protein
MTIEAVIERAVAMRWSSGPRELARELGRTPVCRDLDARKDLFTSRLLRERFGSYERADRYERWGFVAASCLFG